MKGVATHGGDKNLSLLPNALPECGSQSASYSVGALSSGIKRPGRQADHISPYSAEARNEWS
jgi:hypothetical protein